MEIQMDSLDGFQIVVGRISNPRNYLVPMRVNYISTKKMYVTFSNQKEDIELPKYIMNLDSNIEEP